MCSDIISFVCWGSYSAASLSVSTDDIDLPPSASIASSSLHNVTYLRRVREGVVVLWEGLAKNVDEQKSYRASTSHVMLSCVTRHTSHVTWSQILGGIIEDADGKVVGGSQLRDERTQACCTSALADADDCFMLKVVFNKS